METIGGMIFFVGIIFCIIKSNSFEGFVGKMVAFSFMISPMFIFFDDGFQRGFAIFKFADVLIFSIMALVGGVFFLGSTVDNSKISNGIFIALICIVIGMWGAWIFSEDPKKVVANNTQNNYSQNYSYGNYNNNAYTGSYNNYSYNDYPTSNNYSYNTQSNNNVARVKEESGGTFKEIFIEGVKKYGAELVCAALIALTAFVLSKMNPSWKKFFVNIVSKHEIQNPDSGDPNQK